MNSGLSATNPIFSDSGIIGDNSQVDSWSDVDLIAFQLEEGQRVTIDVDAWSVGTDLDSILRLFDGQGQEVAYSFGDPAPGEHWSPDPYLEFQAFTTGTYYVGVSSYSNGDYDPLVEGSGNGFDGGGNTGGYTINIALDQGNGRETANDTIFNAIATGLSSTNPGTYKEIGVIGDNVSDSPWFDGNPPWADVDFYKVQLNQGERVQIDIDAQQFGSYLDAELRLFDSRGYDVAFSSSDPAPGETNFGFDPYIDFIAPENGTYYIGVSSNGNYYDPFSSQMNGGGNSHGEYSLEVTVGEESGSSGIERLFATPMDGSDHIVELNPLTGAEINRFVAPDWVSEGPDSLAYDGNSLFFTNGFDSLWELNPDTGTVIDSDFLPGGMGSIDGLAALGGKVYLLDYQRKDIIEFDPNSDTITNILDIDVINPSITMVGGLGAMTNPNQLLVTNDQDTIFAIDPNTGVISDTFFTGTTNLLGGVAVVNNEIYVDSFMGDQTIDVLDQNGVFQRTLSLPYDISALGGDGVGVSQTDLSYESNDTIAQALQSGLTGTNPGRFTDIGIIGDNPNHPESDVDLIAFQLNPGQRVTIDIDEVFDSRLDAALRLFNSTGEEVAFSTRDLAPGESVWEPYIEFEAFHSDS